MSICGLRLYFTDRSGGVGNRALGAVRSLCRREQTLSYLGNQLTAAAGPPLLEGREARTPEDRGIQGRCQAPRPTIEDKA